MRYTIVRLHDRWALYLLLRLSPCIALVNVLNPSDRVTVNGGRFNLNLQNGMPAVYYPASSTFHVEADDSDVSIL